MIINHHIISFLVCSETPKEFIFLTFLASKELSQEIHNNCSCSPTLFSPTIYLPHTHFPSKPIFLSYYPPLSYFQLDHDEFESPPDSSKTYPYQHEKASSHYFLSISQYQWIHYRTISAYMLIHLQTVVIIFQLFLNVITFFSNFFLQDFTTILNFTFCLAINDKQPF